MKKIINLLLAALAPVLALSCVGERALSPQSEGEKLELEAVFEPSVKTALNPDFSVRWKADDRISVSGGTNSVAFGVKSLAQDGFTATFAGEIPSSSHYRAFYPYQKELLWTEKTVTAVLPRVQQAVEGSFADGTALAMAEVIGNRMMFRNIGVVLAFVLHDEDIREIRLSSNDGTPLAGRVTLRMESSPVVDKISEGVASIVLKGDFIKEKTYYMTALPGVHAKGFSLCFVNSAGQTVDYTASKPLTLERNANVRLADFKIGKPWQSHYFLVKDAGKLKEGDVVRIGCPSQDVAAGVYLTDKKYLSKVDAVFSGDEMISPDAVDLRLSRSGNLWKLMTENKELGTSGAKKMTLQPANETGLQGQDAPNTLWSIDIDGEGLASLTSGEHGRILYNVNSPRFLNYTSGLNAAMLLPQLYRKAMCPEELSEESTGETVPEPSPEPDPQPESPAPALGQTDWLEMPGVSGFDGKMGVFHVGADRNYSYNYDTATFTSMWVAYPLYAATTGGKREGSWKSTPGFTAEEQINIWKGSYKYQGADYYARGHQIPDADRSGNGQMQQQTYYAINSTPQIQERFNAGIWSALENGVRDAIPSGDTLYVVTGASFNKNGEQLPVKTFKPKWDAKDCMVPNYYWKVLLKVKRNGDRVTGAKTIGFWLPHEELTGSYQAYAVTVDQIEEWTGFDFFVNLPSGLQAAAEKEQDWAAFRKF